MARPGLAKPSGPGIKAPDVCSGPRPFPRNRRRSPTFCIVGSGAARNRSHTCAWKNRGSGSASWRAAACRPPRRTTRSTNSSRPALPSPRIHGRGPSAEPRPYLVRALEAAGSDRFRAPAVVRPSRPVASTTPPRGRITGIGRRNCSRPRRPLRPAGAFGGHFPGGGRPDPADRLLKFVKADVRNLGRRFRSALRGTPQCLGLPPVPRAASRHSRETTCDTWRPPQGRPPDFKSGPPVSSGPPAASRTPACCFCPMSATPTMSSGGITWTIPRGTAGSSKPTGPSTSARRTPKCGTSGNPRRWWATA